jgi:hypothetical protein
MDLLKLNKELYELFFYDKKIKTYSLKEAKKICILAG